MLKEVKIPLDEAEFIINLGKTKMKIHQALSSVTFKFLVRKSGGFNKRVALLLFLSALLNMPSMAMQTEISLKQDKKSPLIDWIIPFDKNHPPRPWNEEINKVYSDRKFFEDPDFIADMKPIVESGATFELSHPLNGMVYLRVMMKKLGWFPNKKSYTLQENQYILRNLLGIGMLIQMTMNDFKWIPHVMRDLSFDPTKKNGKKFTPEEILYSRIPWRELEGIGKFANNLLKKDCQGRDLVLFQAALPDLLKDFQNLIQGIENIIVFYQQDRMTQISQDIPLHMTPSNIKLFGAFIRDRESLLRIKDVLFSIDKDRIKKDPLFSVDKHKAAVLRVLNITGESGIGLSCVSKKRIMSENSWAALQKIRNAFHKYELQNRLQEIFFGKADFLPIILTDFKNLHAKIQGIKLFERDTKWEDVKAFYNPKDINSSLTLESIIDLSDMAAGQLSREKKDILLEHIDKYFSDTAESLLSIKNMLLNKDVSSEQREKFLTILKSLKITNNERKKLEELYKKRSQEFKNLLSPEQEENIKNNIKEGFEKLKDNKNNILLSLKSRESLEDGLKNIVNEIHQYENWEKLKAKLSKLLAFLTEEELIIWKKSFESLPSLTATSRKKKITTLDKIKLLSEDILKDIDTASSFVKGYLKVPLNERLKTYIDDKLTPLAIEYTLGSFRQKAQNLWEIMNKLYLEGKCQKLAPKTCTLLDYFINRTKSILHNHDVTEISTVTYKGTNLSLLLEDIPGLLGDLCGIDFPLVDATLTFTLINGDSVRMPVLDYRLLRQQSIKQTNTTLPSSLRQAITDSLRCRSESGPTHLKTLYQNLKVGKSYILFKPLPFNPSESLAQNLKHLKGINL